jgi:hypothetical protein
MLEGAAADGAGVAVFAGYIDRGGYHSDLLPHGMYKGTVGTRAVGAEFTLHCRMNVQTFIAVAAVRKVPVISCQQHHLTNENTDLQGSLG